AALQSS
nr:Chain A, AALQSS [Homo sapiens]